MHNNKYQYHKTLEKLSNEELVTAFNRQVCVPGWGNARAVYSTALRTEFLNRDFDSTLIISEVTLSFARKVSLQNKELKFL